MTAATTRNEKVVEKTPEKTKATTPSPPFEVKTLHEKALSKLLHCHHGGILLTYESLSLEIGIGEKTKSWQCGAWKDLKKGGYIVSGPEPKTIALSPGGVDLATSFASDEELAEFKIPATDDELHEKIRKRLGKNKKHSGTKIFDLLLRLGQSTPSLRLELASGLGTNPDSHGFYYGFKALEKMKLVSVAGKVSRDELVRRATAAEATAISKKRNNNKASKTKTKKTKNDESVKLEEGGDAEAEDSKEEEAEQQLPKRKRGKKDAETKLEDHPGGAKVSEGPETKKARIRGGSYLFLLSEKAFLTKASATTKPPTSG